MVASYCMFDDKFEKLGHLFIHSGVSWELYTSVFFNVNLSKRVSNIPASAAETVSTLSVLHIAVAIILNNCLDYHIWVLSLSIMWEISQRPSISPCRLTVWLCPAPPRFAEEALLYQLSTSSDERKPSMTTATGRPVWPGPPPHRSGSVQPWTTLPLWRWSADPTGLWGSPCWGRTAWGSLLWPSPSPGTWTGLRPWTLMVRSRLSRHDLLAISEQQVNKSQHPSPIWDLTAALPVLRGGICAHSLSGWRGEHHHYLWQLETGEPDNTSLFPQSFSLLPH